MANTQYRFKGGTTNEISENPMKIMEALTKETLKLVYSNRWLVLEKGIFYVFEQKFRKATALKIFKGADEEIAVRFLIEGR
jgi:hypothetical protein